MAVIYVQKEQDPSGCDYCVDHVLTPRVGSLPRIHGGAGCKRSYVRVHKGQTLWLTCTYLKEAECCGVMIHVKMCVRPDTIHPPDVKSQMDGYVIREVHSITYPELVRYVRTKLTNSPVSMLWYIRFGRYTRKTAPPGTFNPPGYDEDDYDSEDDDKDDTAEDDGANAATDWVVLTQPPISSSEEVTSMS